MFSSNTSQVADDKLFVEDCFSTYLYQGNGSTQTITNGIDLAGKGGLVWMKDRVASSYGNHILVDTVQTPAGSYLKTNSTDAAASSGFITFNSNGFYLPGNSAVNISGNATVSWTFRKAPKFFDVVTYTGNGVSGRTVGHSLGVAPGTIIVKRTDAGAGWRVYHRSQPNGYGDISSSDAFYTASAERVFGNGSTVVAPSSTDFTIGDATSINGSGATYVAYLFAHDTTSDGIIQCGSYTGNGSSFGPTVSLGWEPQWLLIKRASAAEDWVIYDNMRGVPTDGIDAQLSANLSNAEQLAQNRVDFTATGFVPRQGYTTTNASGDTYIYIAIRRGPMRTPTSGTSVFSPTLTSSYGTNNLITTGFPVDLCLGRVRANGYSTDAFDRLRGTAATSGRWLSTNTTDAEQTNGFYGVGLTSNTGFFSNWWTQDVGVQWNFRRAPSFFDEVCYTGTGSTQTLNHNLGVAPELIIIKSRNDAIGWDVEANFTSSGYSRGAFNSGAQFYPQTYPDTITAQPTATQFSVSSNIYVGASNYTYVAYLFASCPGVSKVGTYTGNGSSQTINCGFAAGARFVMIKRTDSTGDWYVWDTARGIVSGNDPHLSLNSTAAEVTTDDSVDTDSSGFVVNQLSATNINVSSATYIYLAVA